MKKVGNIFKNITLIYGISMKKYIYILCFLVGIFVGCEKIGKPDIHPENKKGDWYFGWRFDWEW